MGKCIYLQEAIRFILIQGFFRIDTRMARIYTKVFGITVVKDKKKK